jgi:hypothetical protein
MRNIYTGQGMVATQAAPTQTSAPPIGESRPTSVAPSRRRATRSSYDQVMRTLGLLAGLVLLAGCWVAGGYFTLAWLASVGFVPARAGTALVDVMLGYRRVLGVHWVAVAAAWSVPLLITILQIGLWPTRTRHPFATTLFFVVLSFSTFTTAAGVSLSLDTDPTTAWAIGAAVGVFLDLAPEKGARVLWRLLRET